MTDTLKMECLDCGHHWEPDELPWPDPIPLGDVTGPVAQFPVEALPAWMQQQVTSTAEELQAPVDLPGMLALAALSIVYARTRRVHVRSAWHEHLNLYLVVALPPSTGKSPAFKALIGPLEQWERQNAEAMQGQIDQIATKRRITEKALKKAEDRGDVTEALMYADELRLSPELVAPRLVADDATPEALVDLMARHGGSMALVSTEGGLFELIGGRYSDKANLDAYLKAWSGDAIRVDRVGRGSTVIGSPTLTIGLTVQPDVIRALSERPEFAGRGLTARFMYSVPASKVGWRNMIDTADISPAIGARYGDRLLRLLEDERRVPCPQNMELTPEARDEFMQWRQGLEERRRPAGDLERLAEWTTKLESSVARTAALLALADGCDDVDLATMRRAITLGLYWMSHARAVWDLWGCDPVVEQAKKILAWAASRELTEFSVRDVYMGMRATFPSADDTRPALGLLTEREWIRPLFEGPLVTGRRGKESPRFAIHPSNLWISGTHASHASHAPRDVSESLTYFLSTDTETEMPVHETHDSHEPPSPSSGRTTTPPRSVVEADPMEDF